MAPAPDPRELAVRALKANPVIIMTVEQEARVAQGGDLTFDELDMDSLARMELSIWLELNAGVVLTEAEIGQLGSLSQLAARLGREG